MPVFNPSSPLSVATLNRLVRECLEGNFPLCWVAGEISNLTVASSGHAYFTLKDESAQIRCVMFRNRNALLGWKLANGQHVEARVLVTLYEARGDFQLNVESLRQAGTGNLFERFQKLKVRLEADGLFAAEHKRPIPGFPRRIGIVTSPQAAALRDVLTTMARRAPHVELIVFPTPVQGESASAQIAAAIETASASGLCETLIVCRGGGSMEDLWAFNEEVVARAIRNCTIPVISGIGHETDFTIADFAADLRAPTPTAAAEIAAPERNRLQSGLLSLQASLRAHTVRNLDQYSLRLDHLEKRLSHPAERLTHQRERLRHLSQRLAAAHARQQALGIGRCTAIQQRLLLARPNIEALKRRTDALLARMGGAQQRLLATSDAKLARIAGSLTHLNPLAVLGRGYALVHDEDGHIVRNAATMEPSATIHVYLARGRLDAVVTGVSGNEPQGNKGGKVPAIPDGNI